MNMKIAQINNRFKVETAEGRMHMLNERSLRSIPHQDIEAWRQPLHTMHEDHQMNRRSMGPQIPGHRTLQLRTLAARHYPLQHSKEPRR